MDIFRAPSSESSKKSKCAPLRDLTSHISEDINIYRLLILVTYNFCDTVNDLQAFPTFISSHL